MRLVRVNGTYVFFRRLALMRVVDGVERDHLVTRATSHVVFGKRHPRKNSLTATTHSLRPCVPQPHPHSEHRPPCTCVGTSTYQAPKQPV